MTLPGSAHGTQRCSSAFFFCSPLSAWKTKEPRAVACSQRRAVQCSRGPVHVAIIPDGNGRWGTRQGLTRKDGHTRGVDVMKDCVERCADLGVKYLTVYAMSAENLTRPQAEVDFLMKLFGDFIEKLLAEASERGLRLRFIGDRHALPTSLLSTMENAERDTRHGTNLTLLLGIGYGSRQEIAQVTRDIAADAVAGRLSLVEIDQESFEARLSARHSSLPPPDLLIRTGGERRLSNFLLWQLAYTELYFCEEMWPDFDGASLDTALAWFENRKRRFGKLPAQGAD